ncbi:hypothetical protein ACFOY4_01305 [Actinomadura syzygii]|uniref:Uncharacterized protein n=1 Tax=Actinomadura syzygii TaxID=1427538 RepID=A0A5D0TSC4_9ACTN|nr:hypothetical protein [Actinomadura syzygii]TYC08613.1 hypothetical protein FXF65_37605 [Actinomadura syzygii]
MANGFNELLAGVSTDEVLDVDTSFLDAYRRTGTGAAPRSDEQFEPRSEPDTDGGDDHDFRASDEDADEWGSEYQPDTEGDVRQDSPSGQHGGGSAAGSGAAGAISAAVPRAQPSDRARASETSEPTPAAEPACGQEEAKAHLQAENAVRQESVVVSAHRETDQQDVIQSAASSGKKRGGGYGDASLPNTGFSLPSTAKQPYIRNVPQALTGVLRERLRSAAVREKGVSDAAAQAFCRSLGQTALVTAFLMAQLDVRIDTDASTATAAELFRSQNPLLGSVVARMDELERHEHDQATQLEKLIDDVAAIKQTGQVLEQGLAYAIADKTENLVRGAHNVGVVDPTHRSAMVVRDKIREATASRMRLERERDGRPIR